MSSTQDVTRELIDAWRSGEHRSTTPAARLPDTAPAVVLDGDGPAGGTLDLGATLRARRSLRDFGGAPLRANDVLDVVATGLADERSSREDGWPDLPELEITAVALNLEGLGPGVHRLDASRRSAAYLGPLPADPETLTLQSEFTRAAVILSLGADLATAEANAGVHGYRRLMTSASAAAYGMWLEAVARGWIGSVFAGLLPAALRQSTASDGASRHQMFALAIGVPAATPSPDSSSAPRVPEDPMPTPMDRKE